ncbi:MAG: amidohydrolase family protein [Alphaproteobacteria bacterium]|nr:amidohydrolase family protein [Alphaproteobacteria bacterium]
MQVLRGAHVIDRSQGIDRVVDVAIADGKIHSIGDVPTGGEVLDVSGSYLSPGWIDIHVHVYGTLGFADPDSIGVYQGVTTFIEAGGPGIDTLDEFAALTDGRMLTRLYVGPYCMRPSGLISLNFIEGDSPRTLTHIPIVKWLDYMQEQGDRLRYMKIGAYGGYGKGAMHMARGLAETVGRPLYIHIGEHQLQPGADDANEIFGIARPGDIITHLFHPNKYGLLDDDGKVLPGVYEAVKRGVLFDVGYGGFNFSWAVADKVMAQGVVPDIISSDLQQFNVLGPVRSLSHVMSACMHLGMMLNEVLDRVTFNPARALRLDDRAGALKPGMPADITVFIVESGEFEIQDTRNRVRKAGRRIVPRIAFKDGRRVDCDLLRAHDERNWLMQIAEDDAPEAMRRLSGRQRKFLGALAAALSRVEWSNADIEPSFNLPKSMLLHDVFRQVVAQTGIPLKGALNGFFDCFLNHPFSMQAGVFLLRLPRTLALERLREAAAAELAAH